MTPLLSREEIGKLPWLESIPSDGRIVVLQPYYDSDARQWHFYVEHAPGRLIRIADGETISGSYYGREAADPDRDLESPLGTLVTRHLSFEAVVGALGRLDSDVHRFAAVLEKYDLIWRRRAELHFNAPLLVEAELEYLLLLTRSFYDCLQGVIRHIARRLHRSNGAARRAMRDLPRSFAAVVVSGDKTRDAEEIVAKFQAPKPLAEWYCGEAEFFLLVRGLRDGIAHHGKRPLTIFELDRGFCVEVSATPWNSLVAWSEGRVWSGRLGSLHAVFADVISHSIGATSRLAAVIPEFLSLSAPMSRDVHYFVRSPFGRHLTSIEATRLRPWEGRTTDVETSSP